MTTDVIEDESVVIYQLYIPKEDNPDEYKLISEANHMVDIVASACTHSICRGPNQEYHVCDIELDTSSFFTMQGIKFSPYHSVRDATSDPALSVLLCIAWIAYTTCGLNAELAKSFVEML